MRIGIIIADSNGGYPVPASKGGAVSTLVEHIVKENNYKQLFKLDIVSVYDFEAEKLSKQYPNIRFRWIKVPKVISIIDRFIFFSTRKLFPNVKSVSYKTLASLAYIILRSSHILRQTKYDKIVLENNIPLAWAVKLSDYKGDYYYHLHNVPRINAKCKKVFENCTGYLCVSRYVANQIASANNPIGPVDQNRIKVLYNCINVKDFHPNKGARKSVREKYFIRENDVLLLFVGRLSAEKGIDKLLEAGKQLDENYKILIVGSLLHGADGKDSYFHKLKKSAEQLYERIFFTGYIAQWELPDYYNAADIAVLPSMWDEPAGLTMVEANACGLPLITTESGGIPEYAGECGIVLKRDEQLVHNLVCSIRKIANSLERYPSERAIRRVTENFNSDRYLERFLETIMGNNTES